MKKMIKLIGLVALIMVSFFYTDKVVNVVRENDSLMLELEKVKELYTIEASDAIIENNTIIPGMNGRKININKSYKKMRELGIFNKELIVYDDIKPNSLLNDNRDKFIISGNNNKQMVSIIFIIDNDKYLKTLEKYANESNVLINYFVSYDFLMENSTYITKLKNREIYNYGNDGEYTPDNIIFANNFISRITNNEANYCLTTDKNKKTIELCSDNNLLTISPELNISTNPYSKVTQNAKSGSIILLELNNNTVTEFNMIVNYLKGKGLKIGGLSELLSEKL